MHRALQGSARIMGGPSVSGDCTVRGREVPTLFSRLSTSLSEEDGSREEDLRLTTKILFERMSARLERAGLAPQLRFQDLAWQ